MRHSCGAATGYLPGVGRARRTIIFNNAAYESNKQTAVMMITIIDIVIIIKKRGVPL